MRCLPLAMPSSSMLVASQLRTWQGWLNKMNGWTFYLGLNASDVDDIRWGLKLQKKKSRWDLSSICFAFVPQCSASTHMGSHFWVCTLRIFSCCILLVFLFYHYCILFCNVIVYYYFLVYDYDDDCNLLVWWSGLDSVPNWANVTVVQSDNCWMLNAEIILDCRDGIKMHNWTGSKKAESGQGS